MRFSILIPVYNVEKYLKECLDKISQQSYKDYEVILVDDGSTDKSGLICDEYCKSNCRAKVIHKINEGLISARRIAINNAKGEYCVFCDSDDFLELEALNEINKIVEKREPDIIIYNAYKYIDGKKEKFFQDVFSEGMIQNKQDVYTKLLIEYSINSLCLKTVKRSIFDNEKDYNMFYGCNFGEDLLQTIPIVNNAQDIYYLNKPLYNYRISSGMMRKFNKNYYWSYKKVNQEINKQLIDKNVEHLNQKIAYHLLTAAYGATTQLKYCNNIDFTDVKEISDDALFKKEYQILRKSTFWKDMSIKERVILILLKTENYFLIYFLLKFKMVLKGDKNEK